MSQLNPNKFGVNVSCKVCNKRKAPRGRSVAAMMVDLMCNHECAGYLQEPLVGSLWPAESEADFGYEVGDIGTRILEEAK